MDLAEIDLHEAATLDETADLLQRFAPDVRILAGGTDLLLDLKSARIRTRHVISIGGIRELRGLRAEDGGLRIGALTTLSDLSRSDLLAGPCFSPHSSQNLAPSRNSVPQFEHLTCEASRSLLQSLFRLDS